MPKASKEEPKAKGLKTKDYSKKTAAKGNKAGTLSVPIYSLDGKETGQLNLPKEVFGVKVNKQLLAQAARVYITNQSAHYGNTKTRGEVKGSTRKIRSQKGTGGARHGSIKAPIFVHGGIALGPKFRKVILDLPKKMKKAAFLCALSSKFQDKEVLGITLDKVSGKTAQVAKTLSNMKKVNVLIVDGERNEKVSRAVRNLSKVNFVSADQLNILQLISHQTLMVTKEAVERLEFRIKEKTGEKK